MNYNPMKLPRAEVKSEWRGTDLWWCINGEWISDIKLKHWIYMNLEYPNCYIDCIRQYHCDAFAAGLSKNSRHNSGFLL